MFLSEQRSDLIEIEKNKTGRNDAVSDSYWMLLQIKGRQDVEHVTFLKHITVISIHVRIL